MLAAVVAILDASLLEQLREVRSTESSDRVPTLSNREAVDVAAVAGALGDIVETLIALLVQPGIQEAKGSLAAGDESIVDKGEDAGGQRRGRGGSADGALSAVPNVGEVEALRGDIGVGTAV